MWTERRMLGFDVESTGVDPREARIVTAALVFVGGSEPTQTQTWLADPGIEIPEEAANIHGVTTEKARAEGRPAREVIVEIIEAMEGRPDGAPVVAFNARYDLTVLCCEAARHGVDFDFGGLLVVDPIVIDKHLDRYRPGSRKLAAVCAHYGARLDGAHDSAADAVAAARCAWVIGRRAVVIRRVRNGREGHELAQLVKEWDGVRGDLRKLHEAQARWAADQARGLAEYFVEQGKMDEALTVEAAWPVLPARVAEEEEVAV